MQSYIQWREQKGNFLLAAEPRYDHVSFEMALLIYALRLVLPNHFHYHKKSGDALITNVQKIFAELSESNKTQSEMNNESSSDLIIKTIREYFQHIELGYTTPFFDKIIGSIRVAKQDAIILSGILKQLDNIIVKYNPNFARTITIKAQA